ncbi:MULTISPECIES: hypothetical protein [unclassified Brevibacterium]|uniref:hypothetical protein n=1 Tax=unclassified Brevibacterium TaxID=2614124 RepID=UPI0014856731|nr:MULTISPECIES: hypothetical protein [unclassified Brevibacterium]MCM1011603.1 hypothetical protein [Brevibacterium sp. XM4083]
MRKQPHRLYPIGTADPALHGSYLAIPSSSVTKLAEVVRPQCARDEQQISL